MSAEHSASVIARLLTRYRSRDLESTRNPVAGA